MIPKDVEVIALDFETTGLKTWLPDFRIVSCAACWPTPEGYKFAYTEGEADTRLLLEVCMGKTLIIQNVSYEMACIMSRYPDLWERMSNGVTWVDCARLVQNWDGGGAEYDDGAVSLFGGSAKKNTNTGFRLEALASRVLEPKYHNHKQPYIQWILDNIPGTKKKGAGAHLAKLPPAMLQRYNELDTEITFEVYRVMCEKFTAVGFDWRLDHQLYIQCCKYLADSSNRGVPVDREQLAKNIQVVEAEISEIRSTFCEKYAAEILQVEGINRQTLKDKLKSEKGKSSIESDPKKEKLWRFKVSSTKQLKILFVDVLGISYTFTTPKGGPSFKSAFLSQWGDGGTLLEKRGKRQLVMNQMIALYNMSEESGKWHWNMKALGTKTGRLAGGNVNG